MRLLSRRSALFSAATIPAFVVARPVRALEDNSVLLALGRQFDAMAVKLDCAIEQALDIDWSDLEEFGRIVDEIVVTPATTIEGLCVKARVGCWGLLGDLDDPGEQSTAGERMSLSITRDLIRLRHPDLERPGALKKLVKEIEETAVGFSKHV
jgi:hypothetical protein